MNEFKAVRDFMWAVGQDVPVTPRIPTADVIKLRIKLVEEETTELLKDLYWILYWLEKHPDLPMPQDLKLRALTAIADDVADVNYVVNGTGVACGFDGEATFSIVHDANMQKLTGPKREDGKQLKPADWQPPEPAISKLIERQWRDYIPPLVEQTAGVPWEGPQDVQC